MKLVQLKGGKNPLWIRPDHVSGLETNKKGNTILLMAFMNLEVEMPLEEVRLRLDGELEKSEGLKELEGLLKIPT